MIYVVYYENPGSTSGAEFTGIFDNRVSAKNFAESEGPSYKVAEMGFGPIDWNKIFPTETDWEFDEKATKELKRNLLRPNEGLFF